MRCETEHVERIERTKAVGTVDMVDTSDASVRAAVGAIRFRVARSLSYEDVLALPLPQAETLRAALATYRAAIGFDPQPRVLLPYSDRRALWLAQGKRCYLCRRYVPTFSAGETDHRQPLYRSGTNTSENLAFACLDCNRHKGIRTEAEYHQMLRGQDDLISQLEPERERIWRELDAIRDAMIEAEVARRIPYNLSATYQQKEQLFDPEEGEHARC